MPSGGGSAGGGGGGGGGGGYFDGDRDVLFRSNRRRSFNFGSGSGGGGDGGGLSWCSLIIIGLILLGVLLLCIIITVSVRASHGSSRPTDVASDLYSPGDSRLISHSSFYCERINIEVDSTDTNATLTLVSSTPSLSESNLVSISDQRVLEPRHFWFWQYHLYPNSNVSIGICIETEMVEVYMAKGNANANDWASSPSQDHAEVTREIHFPCPHKEMITYNVTEEDEYYLFIYNPDSLYESNYSANLQFERFEYALPSESPASCFASSGGECSVGIPYGTGSQQVLVVTTIPENVDWGENVDININCNKRQWAYAVVILIPLLVVIALIVGALVFMYFGCKWWCTWNAKRYQAKRKARERARRVEQDELRERQAELDARQEDKKEDELTQ